MNNTLEKWISENIKSQIGKTVLITGANFGIGFFTALAFAKAGAHVIVTGRDPEKLEFPGSFRLDWSCIRDSQDYA